MCDLKQPRVLHESGRWNVTWSLLTCTDLGPAGTTEEQIRYTWNYAMLIAHGPSQEALIKSPIFRAMESGSLARFEEINDELAREVSRRISPGVPADLGAGWFEGLAQRNRYALLARQALWEQFADYIASLDDEQFKRALVFLRRAFGSFSAREKRHIAENLGQCWGLTADTASELIEEKLSESEEKTLEDLNEFDFGDI